jgi:hypothetical protein
MDSASLRTDLIERMRGYMYQEIDFGDEEEMPRIWNRLGNNWNYSTQGVGLIGVLFSGMQMVVMRY